jgi:predicted nucleic acid-binding protein
MSAGAPVVSNAGPLIALAKLNLLHLLKDLYGRIYFTSSVYNETVIEGLRQGHEDAGTLHLFLDQMAWRPEEVDPADIPIALREAYLDQGERDTLALAERLGSVLVLMDETVGRQLARDRGLAVRGSLGLLVEAYQRGLIQADQLRLYLEEMARRQDIWINPSLAERLLKEVLGDR